MHVHLQLFSQWTSVEHAPACFQSQPTYGWLEHVLVHAEWALCSCAIAKLNTHNLRSHFGEITLR